MEQSQQPLRQPVNLWQWLTGQPGTLYTPTPPPIIRVNPPKSALDVIEDELVRLHEEIDDYKDQMEYEGDGDRGYHRLLDSLDKLNGELIRRSQEETKSET
jgi:hypothetical protein